MSGTIVPGQTLVAASVNRQTIPYGDRPFVTFRNGRGYLTQDGYQFLVRMQQATVATVTNVGSVIAVSNTIIADLSTIESEIATIFEDIAEIEQELTAGVASIPPLPPFIGNPGPVEVTPLPASFNFEPADFARAEADARACAYWGL